MRNSGLADFRISGKAFATPCNPVVHMLPKWNMASIVFYSVSRRSLPIKSSRLDTGKNIKTIFILLKSLLHVGKCLLGRELFTSLG